MSVAYPVRSVDSSQGETRPVHEAVHSTPSSVRLGMDGGLPPLPVYLRVVQKKSFTFTLPFAVPYVIETPFLV
jgi:hypothetical protein